MAGLICLQGGGEFAASCRPLDLQVLRASPPGPTVVLAGAARRGRDYQQASRNALRYYRGLGADPVVAAPDPRDDLEACLDVLRTATLVVLPGGSPSGLLKILVTLGDGAVGVLLRELHTQGAVISGASAGAMVLCEVTWRPDADGGVTPGLGLVPGLALPHWSPGRSRPVPVDAATPRWGLPECGGVLVDDGGVRAAGQGAPSLLLGDEVTELPRDRTIAPFD